MLCLKPLLPIRDIQARLRTPYGCFLALGVLVGVFAYQVSLGPRVGAWVRAYGLVPARLMSALSEAEPAALGSELSTLVTATFLHGGWLHLFGNLLYLRVFGERVEGRLGTWGFGGLYLLAGLAGSAAHVAFSPGDTVPMIGASGAVAGVLGTYVVLFPKARITTLFPAVIALTFVELPAILFVGLWAAQQALNGYLVLAEGIGARDVAWLAHAGGFGLGMLLGVLIRIRSDRRPRGRRPRATGRPARSNPERTA